MDDAKESQANALPQTLVMAVIVMLFVALMIFLISGDVSKAEASNAQYKHAAEIVREFPALKSDLKIHMKDGMLSISEYSKLVGNEQARWKTAVKAMAKG